jgi:hypothetical protein
MRELNQFVIFHIHPVPDPGQALKSQDEFLHERGLKAGKETTFICEFLLVSMLLDPDPDLGQPNQSGSGSTKLTFSRTGLTTVPVYSYSRYSVMHPILDYQLKKNSPFLLIKATLVLK